LIKLDRTLERTTKSFFRHTPSFETGERADHRTQDATENFQKRKHWRLDAKGRDGKLTELETSSRGRRPKSREQKTRDQKVRQPRIARTKTRDRTCSERQTDFRNRFDESITQLTRIVFSHLPPTARPICNSTSSPTSYQFGDLLRLPVDHVRQAGEPLGFWR